MSGTFTNLLNHIVFSTKNRENRITDKFAEELYAYIGGIIRDEGGHLLAAGGTQNHLHLLVVMPTSIALSDLLRKIKGNSSSWINENNKMSRKFAWQAGYGAFSVSESSKGEVTRYISNQQEHHKKLTFKEEFLRFLDKNNIEYDKRYLWE